MKRLAIVRPLPLVIGGTVPGVANLLTPNPKEVAAPAAAGQTIDLDLGAALDFDTLFLGFSYGSTNATAAITVSYGAGAYNTNALAGGLPIANSRLVDGFRHFVRVLDAPVNGRYIRLTVPAGIGPTAGVVAVGKSFQAFWGHEYGAGRFLEDTGSAERLLGGAFGINEGAIVGGYQWQFGDLTPDEREDLFALVKLLGQTKSVLVIEDVDATNDLGARTHWSLFARLEPYERLNPLDTRWAFKVMDWG